MAEIEVVDQIYSAPTGPSVSAFSGFASGGQDAAITRPEISTAAAQFDLGRNKNGFALGTHIRIDVAMGERLRKRAIVDKAVLQVRASAVGTDAFQVAIGSPRKDGIWDVLNLAQPQLTLENDVSAFQLGALTGSFGPNQTGIGALILGYLDPGGPGIGSVGLQIAGQSFSAPPGGIGSCQSIRASAFRTQSAAGTIRAVVYKCAKNDGTDDRPVGNPIGTSGAIDIQTGLSESIPGPQVNFLFQGASKFDVPAGERRYVAFDWYERSRLGGGPLVANTDYVAIGLNNVPSGIPNGSAGVGSPAFAALDSGWGLNNYPNSVLFPWLYGNAGEYLPGTNRLGPTEDIYGSPYQSPVGPVIALAAPPFPSVGDWVDFPGMDSLIQGVIDDDSFDENQTPNLVGLGVHTTTGAADNELREGDDVRLVLSWHWDPLVTGLATYSRAEFSAVVGAKTTVDSVVAAAVSAAPVVSSGPGAIVPAASSKRSRIDPVAAVDRIDVSPSED